MKIERSFFKYPKVPQLFILFVEGNRFFDFSIWDNKSERQIFIKNSYLIEN